MDAGDNNTPQALGHEVKNVNIYPFYTVMQLLFTNCDTYIQSYNLSVKYIFNTMLVSLHNNVI